MTTEMKLNTFSFAALAILAAFGVVSCKPEYDVLENRAFIAQSNLQSHQAQSLTIGNDAISGKLNVRVSSPVSDDTQFQVVIDDQVVADYNAVNNSTLKPLSSDQYELKTTEISVKKGSVTSDDILLDIKAPTQEMKDSGEKYAVGVRVLPGKSTNGVALTDGADRFVFILKQQVIQSVIKMNIRSNVVLQLDKEYGLTNWTVEFFVNIDRLGKRAKDLNNQALFGVWGTNAEVDGEKHSGEIYTRFGDAFLEGDRLQIKTKGTQMNSNQHFSINTWYHLAFVCTDTKLYLYVNGVLDNSMDLNAGKVWISTTPRLGNTDYLRANVQYAQLRLWEVARTQEQILENMASVNPQSEGLIGYWKFDEGEGNTFKDATKKNPDATAESPVQWVPDIKLN